MKLLKLLKKNRNEYIIELFLVMLGIIIPFLIYKCSDNITERELEKTYKTMLITDFKSDSKLLTFNHNNIVEDQKKIFTFLEAINNENSINIEELKKIIPRLVKYYHFIPNNSTIKDLTSTGNLKIIRDLETRQKIFDYYRLAELINRIETSYELETENYIKPTILKYFPIRNLKQYDFEYKQNIKFPIDLNALENDVHFENVLLIKNDLLNNLRETYKSLIELNNKTILSLKE